MVKMHMGEPCPYAITRSLEMAMATLMFVIGIILLMPGETFSLPQYTVVKALIGEVEGGLIFIATALIRAIGLWVNGTRRQTPLLRLFGCMIGAGFWLTMFIAMLRAVPELDTIPLMSGVSLVAFASEFYSGLRCGADASYLRTFRSNQGAPKKWTPIP
jgi:vacuolar-type H+-ATPase subunit I/STV1